MMHVRAVVMNVEADIAAYTVLALGDARVLNKQLHIRPPLNLLSQHDMAHIWEDKVGLGAPGRPCTPACVSACMHVFVHACMLPPRSTWPKGGACWGVAMGSTCHLILRVRNLLCVELGKTCAAAARSGVPPAVHRLAPQPHAAAGAGAGEEDRRFAHLFWHFYHWLFRCAGVADFSLQSKDGKDRPAFAICICGVPICYAQLHAGVVSSLADEGPPWRIIGWHGCEWVLRDIEISFGGCCSRGGPHQAHAAAAAEGLQRGRRDHAAGPC